MARWLVVQEEDIVTLYVYPVTEYRKYSAAWADALVCIESKIAIGCFEILYATQCRVMAEVRTWYIPLAENVIRNTDLRSEEG